VADRVPDDLPRPRIEDHGQIGELSLESQVREVCNPDLIGAVGLDVVQQIGKDGLVVRGIRRADEPPARPCRQGTFAHHAGDAFVD